MEPLFIGSVPKGVRSRLWTFLGMEWIKLERVKYRLHIKFCQSHLSFYPSRSKFFGHVNGPLVCNKSLNTLTYGAFIRCNGCGHFLQERKLARPF